MTLESWLEILDRLDDTLAPDFPTRARWKLLRMIMRQNVSFGETISAIGRRPGAMARKLIALSEMRVSDIAEVCFAYGAEADFKLIPRRG